VNAVWPWIVLVVALFLAATLGGQGMYLPGGPRWRRRFRGLLRRGWLGPAIVFLASLAAGSWKQYSGPPLPPLVHDEFSYLLAADTFLHGRLTNPTPAGWQSFEAFHELMRPTYMSKYPPGQGLLLAGGRLIGLPHDGTFFVIALACAAVCWMAGAWLRPKWALVAGLLAAWAPIDIFWGSNYWGGGGAMLGGALLSGAALRLMRPRGTARPILLGIMAAVGLGMLANTRPFEGLILAALLGVGVFISATSRPRIMRPLLRAAVYGMPLLICVVAWMAYYNWRVTGNALVMPYMEHTRQYMMAPLFRFESPRPDLQYQTPRVRELHAIWEFSEYQRERTWSGFASVMGGKFVELCQAWLSPGPVVICLAVAAVVFGIGAVGRRRQSIRLGALVRMAALPLAVVIFLPLIQQSLTDIFRPQYLAPDAGFFYLMAGVGACAIATWAGRTRGIVGRAGAAFVPALLLTQLIAAVVAGMPDHGAYLAQERLAIIQTISKQPGNHIIFVAYPPGFEVADELVWNDADIPNEKVIFARWFNAEQAQKLMQLYPGRTPWHIAVNGPSGGGPVYHVGPGI
jgi:hypothetical protein